MLDVADLKALFDPGPLYPSTPHLSPGSFLPPYPPAAMPLGGTDEGPNAVHAESRFLSEQHFLRFWYPDAWVAFIALFVALVDAGGRPKKESFLWTSSPTIGLLA